MAESHTLNLIDNSISFFREAVICAGSRDQNQDRWKFAIIHLVQAMELALKEALRRIHPAFVFEDIDNQNSRKTISISKAIDRLRNGKIGKLEISGEEEKQFQSAIRLRNQLVHFEYSFQAEHAEAKFSSIFAFMLFFYQEHLGLERADIISGEQYERIFALTKARDELLRRTRDYISANKIRDVWCCPECLEDTFIVSDERCKLCGCEEQVACCPNCGEKVWEFQLKDITKLFDIDEDEGRYRVMDNYEYDYDEVCPDCFDNIREDIRQKRFDKYCENMEAEAYYQRHGGDD